MLHSSLLSLFVSYEKNEVLCIIVGSIISHYIRIDQNNDVETLIFIQNQNPYVICTFKYHPILHHYANLDPEQNLFRIFNGSLTLP